MATLHLYVDRYGGTEKTFQCAEVDLETGQWYDDDHKTTGTYDYQLVDQSQDVMPTSGDPVWLVCIDIPTKGINFLRNYPTRSDDSKSMVPIGPYDPIKEDGSLTPPVTKTEEQPTDWSYTWNNYFTRNNVTNVTKPYWGYAAITNSSSPNAPAFSGPYFKFNSGGFRQFWTTGQGYFAAHNYYINTGTRITQWCGFGNHSTTNTGTAAASINSVWFQCPGYGSTRLFARNYEKRRIDYSVQQSSDIEAKSEARIMNCFVAFTTSVTVTTKDEDGNDVVTEELKDFVGPCCVELGADGTPQRARIVGLSLEFWQPEGQVGTWGPDSGIEGGEGTFTAPSDNRGDNNGDTAGGIASDRNNNLSYILTRADIIHVWRMDDGQDVNLFTAALWNQDFFGAYKQSAFNPVSAILSFHMMPKSLAPGSAGRKQIRAAGYGFELPKEGGGTQDVDAPVVSNIYKAHHVGSVDIETYFDAFPDYAPYTSIILHLPFCGTIKVDTNSCMDGWLSVDYICDCTNGNVAAYVTTCDRFGNTQIKYCATGNCAVGYPLFSESQSGVEMGKNVGQMAASFGTAVAGMAALATGAAAPVAAAGALIGGATGVMSSTMKAGAPQHDPQITGSISGNTGAIADGQCFVEIIRPQWSNPAKYDSLIGIPSDISGTLAANDADFAAFGGYVKCKSVDLKGIPEATEEELAEIERIMLSGFHIN